jgi:hypothetical protein
MIREQEWEGGYVGGEEKKGKKKEKKREGEYPTAIERERGIE